MTVPGIDDAGGKLGGIERPGGDVSQASSTRPNLSTSPLEEGALATSQPTQASNPLTLPPGIAIQEALYATDRTQSDLARAVGISQKHLSQIVTGKTGFSAEVALKIEEALGLSALGLTAESLMQAQAEWNVARARRRAQAG